MAPTTRRLDHLVIGAGQVGRAVFEVLEHGRDNVGIRDVDDELDGHRAHMLHVCFPHSADFGEAVARYRERYQPEVVVIHSTVPAGTARALKACASPIRGKHPDLARSILAFVKFFAGAGAENAALAFAACGVATEIVEQPETVEAGKLWDLLQYGISILVQKQMRRWCVDHGVDPDVAYGAFNRTYNAGYAALGHPEYARPVLEEMPGRIGGHCVMPGIALIDDELARLMLAYDETLDQELIAP